MCTPHTYTSAALKSKTSSSSNTTVSNIKNDSCELTRSPLLLTFGSDLIDSFTPSLAAAVTVIILLIKLILDTVVVNLLKFNFMIQIFSLVVFAFLIQGTESRTTLSAPPIISSIQPHRGSTQGGTRLTITGYNFAQNGIFSTRTVLIGNAPCNVINYYTTDGQIICITPACTDPTCINDVNEIKQYTVVSALSLYVTTVEGILGTSSSFTYSTSYTPAVLSMSHYTWGTATSSVRGYISAAYLEDVSVMIGSSGLTSNAAFIGEPGDLNAELWGNSNYRWYYSNGVIYYRFGKSSCNAIISFNFVTFYLDPQWT